MSKEVKELIKYAEERGVTFHNFDLGWITARKGNYEMYIDLLPDTRTIKKKIDTLIAREEQA